MMCADFAQVISAYDVYLNSTLIIHDYQVWRLITNFFYFGKLGIYLQVFAIVAFIIFCTPTTVIS